MQHINLKGNSFLHLAAERGDSFASVVERLLLVGVDPTIVNLEGLTAFDVAHKCRARKVADILKLPNQGHFVPKFELMGGFRRNPNNPQKDENETHVVYTALPEPDVDLDSPSTSIKIEKILGQGAFGEVWLGRTNSGYLLALKSLKESNDLIEKEVSVLKFE